jgi:hypothetical protein
MCSGRLHRGTSLQPITKIRYLSASDPVVDPLLRHAKGGAQGSGRNRCLRLRSRLVATNCRESTKARFYGKVEEATDLPPRLLGTVVAEFPELSLDEAGHLPECSPLPVLEMLHPFFQNGREDENQAGKHGHHPKK